MAKLHKYASDRQVVVSHRISRIVFHYLNVLFLPHISIVIGKVRLYHNNVTVCMNFIQSLFEEVFDDCFEDVFYWLVCCQVNFTKNRVIL